VACHGKERQRRSSFNNCPSPAIVGYLIASLFRFALSRKREYLADAGSAELTGIRLPLHPHSEKYQAIRQ